MIRELISALVEGRELTQDEAAQAMDEMMEGEATPAQIAAFITALRLKGETVEEIMGMAQVMREKSLTVETDGFLVDTAGTGGDGQNTINISTIAAVVAAAAGVKMAKHGNRAASSACGSADVLEGIGIKVDLSPESVKRCLDEVGIGFMFAPVFHPSMSHAGPPRREIGIRTVFNILGPLTNPAGAQAQVLGVADSALGEKMAETLSRLGTRRAMVVHGEDGMDELSITGPTQVWEVSDDKVRSYTVTPEDAGLARSTLDSIKGGSVKRNVEAFRSVLAGAGGPPQDVVLLNTAATLVIAGQATDLRDGASKAREVISSGAAAETLKSFATLSQGLI